MPTKRIIHHALPESSSGDTTWFSRQSPFEQQEIIRQVTYKKRISPLLEDGHLSKLPNHFYPHILPDGHEKNAFYSRIAVEVIEYLKNEHIALHSEALNLKSSQVACINFLFPLKQKLCVATEVFKNFLPDLDVVTGIEFEFTGLMGATEWLGEPKGGMRGQNRTSIDAAVFWQDTSKRKCATLIEWKYTEHNFGVCSAYAGGSTARKRDCISLNVTEDPIPTTLCYLTSGKTHCSRRYWEHMASAGIDFKAFTCLNGCPFQGPFYQLMRQYMLAAYLRENEGFHRADVVSIGFSGNKALHLIPTHLKPIQQPGQDILDLWNTALPENLRMRHINLEEIMAAVDQSISFDREWRTYLKDRYGV